MITLVSIKTSVSEKNFSRVSSRDFSRICYENFSRDLSRNSSYIIPTLYTAIHAAIFPGIPLGILSEFFFQEKLSSQPDSMRLAQIYRVPGVPLTVPLGILPSSRNFTKDYSKNSSRKIALDILPRIPAGISPSITLTS